MTFVSMMTFMFKHVSVLSVTNIFKNDPVLLTAECLIQQAQVKDYREQQGEAME